MAGVVNYPWVPATDANGTTVWLNQTTGAVSYVPPTNNVGVGVQPVYGFGPPGAPPGTTPQHRQAYEPPQSTSSQSMAAIGTWERVYDGDGGKFWVNSVTGQVSNVDPWV